MFDWLWELLYSISKTLFRLIDGLILCANLLCGISPINFEGKETDFLTYLMFSDEVSFAFKISALLATILLVLFTVFMILRSITKDKAEGTPAQIAVKAFKTLLMFFFVPLVMIAFMTIGNAFVKALYAATAQSSASPGAFLFSALAEDGGMASEIAARFRTGELDYNNTNAVSSSMILSDFPFFFSYLVGGVVLFGIGSAMLIFVDRVISLVILYIAAPISISSSVLDDGARFKLWRDQFLSKFIMGYGMILGINIYAMVCGLAMNPDIVFFPGEDEKFINLLMRLLIVGGGALTLQKAMALVGNLVASGAGSSELRDSMSAGALASMTGRAALKAGSLGAKVGFGALGLPFKPTKDVIKEKYAGWVRKKAAGEGNDKGSQKNKESSGAHNDKKADYGSNPNSAKDAIENKGFQTSDWNTKDNGSGNGNNKSPDQKKNDLVNTAINGGKKDGGKQGSENKDQGGKGGNNK